MGEKKKRCPLKPGMLCVSEGNENQYALKIESVIAFGGSCIVYRGYKLEQIGQIQNDRAVIIKEFYPSNLPIERNCNSALSIPEQCLAQFEEKRKLFLDGQSKHSKYYEMAQNRALPRAFLYGEANNTVYAVSDPSAGTALSEIDRNTLSLSQISSIMMSICRCFFPIHDNNLLYLDCKPENIFVSGNDAYLFDFDTLMSRAELYYNSYEFCASSEGWAAPEQLERNALGGYTNSKLIGFHTDIFSIGAVFFWLLTGRKPTKEDLADIQSATPRWMNESPCADSSEGTRKLIDRILKKLLQEDSERRQSNFFESTSVKRLVYGKFEELYNYTMGDNVHYAPIHEELFDAKEAILSAIRGLQTFSIDSASGIPDAAATHGATEIGDIQICFSQEIEKKERLKELYLIAQADFTSQPSDITRSRLNKIEKELGDQENLLSNMRDDMIKGLKIAAQHISKEDIDVREKAALCHIADGNLRKANMVLRDAQWKSEMSDIDIVFLELKVKCERYISGQTILISNLVSLGVNDETDREIRDIYTKIIQLSERYAVSYGVIFDYAKYLYSQACYSESLLMAKRLELIYSLCGCKKAEKNRLSMLIGKICYAAHDYPQSLNYYKSVYDSYTATANVSSEDFTTQEIDILELSQCLADTYWKTNNYIEAEKALKNVLPFAGEILDANGSVAETAENKTIFDAANIFNRLATMSNAKDDLADAEKYHLTALKLKTALIDRNPTNLDDTLLSLSGTYNNIAYLYRKLKKYDQSEEYYIKAFQIRKNGLETNYAKFARAFATVCNNYAVLLGYMQRTEEARKMMLSYVLPIKQDYYNRYPEDSGEVLAYSYSDLGQILSESENELYFDEAEKFFLMAIQMKENLKNAGRITSEKTIAISYQKYADLLKKERKPECRLYYSKALDIFQTLNSANPGYFTRYIKEVEDSLVGQTDG